MVRRIGVMLVWVLATLVATTVALAAVRSVAGHVADEPGSPLFSADELDLGDATTTSAAAPSTSATSSTVVPDDGLVVIPAGPDDAGTTTTTSTTTLTTATTTAPPTSTTAPAVSETTTYQMVGGWVRITSSAGVVTLSGANPNPGFTMEVEHDGPDTVEVEFRNGDHRSRFKAEWSDGELDVDVSEEADDD